MIDSISDLDLSSQTFKDLLIIIFYLSQSDSKAVNWIFILRVSRPRYPPLWEVWAPTLSTQLSPCWSRSCRIPRGRTSWGKVCQKVTVRLQSSVELYSREGGGRWEAKVVLMLENKTLARVGSEIPRVQCWGLPGSPVCSVDTNIAFLFFSCSFIGCLSGLVYLVNVSLHFQRVSCRSSHWKTDM